MGSQGRSILKALLAGLVGGLAGAAAKSIAEKLVPPRTQGQPFPPEVAVHKAQSAAGAHLPPAAEKAAIDNLHWVFGGVSGAVYGAAAEFRPSVTAWKGAAFGLAVNRIMHEGILPRAGMVEPVEDQPAQERVSEWFTHAVYGVTTEVVRGYMRKRL